MDVIIIKKPKNRIHPKLQLFCPIKRKMRGSFKKRKKNHLITQSITQIFITKNKKIYRLSRAIYPPDNVCPPKEKLFSHLVKRQHQSERYVHYQIPTGIIISSSLFPGEQFFLMRLVTTARHTHKKKVSSSYYVI